MAFIRYLSVSALLLFCLNTGGDTGSDEHCAACHVQSTSAFKNNTHHAVLAGEHEGYRCAVCHGDGARHTLTMNAAHIVNPESPEDPAALAACVACHSKAPHSWDKGKTDRQYQCTNCHSIHGVEDE